MELGMDEAGFEYVNFKPSTGKWYLDGNTEQDQIELKDFLLDPHTIQSGWIKIESNVGPEYSWDEIMGVKGPQPSDNHKRGFGVELFIKHGDKPGWRNWNFTQVGSKAGFGRLMQPIDQKDIDAHKNKVMHVTFEGSTANTKGKGPTNEPNFKFVKWVDNPTEGGKPVVKDEPVVKEEPVLNDIDDEIPF